MLQSNAPAEFPFSQRYGYPGQPKGISIWEDASEDLRQCVLETARDLGLAPSDIRDIVCAVLQQQPNRRNWIEYPNVWEEAQEDVYGCQWFQVYDIIERIWSRFKRADDHSVWEEEKAPAFRQAINDFFLTNGIGWQLLKGEIVMRGADGFEAAVKTAQATLEESGRPTASREIHEALEALSWRPEPDLRGAVYHTMGSLECLARAITGDPRATLGEILKKHPDLLPRSLHEALSKMWGSALIEAHHLKEDQQPKREEAELLVGLTAMVATYWSKKCDRPMARRRARTVVRKG
jgi:AbiJ N-terminal domain 4